MFEQVRRGSKQDLIDWISHNTGKIKMFFGLVCKFFTFRIKSKALYTMQGRAQGIKKVWRTLHSALETFSSC